jgi:UV DNA damage endonuclease
MIEAKDKEQAVFELMRTFKLPGFDRIADIIPYERFDDNKEAESAAGQRKIAKGEHFDLVPEEEIGMGGPQGRVYWPLGMEEWLRPKKREVKPKKEDTAEKDAKKKEKLKKEAEKLYAERQAALNGSSSVVKEEDVEEDSDADATPATKKAKAAMKKADAARAAKAAAKVAQVAAKEAAADEKKKTTPAKKGGGRKKAVEVAQPTPSASDEEEEDLDLDAEDSEDAEPVTPAKRPATKRQSGRASRAKVSYAEGGDDEDVDMK